ncbi:hypothetical protein [Gimibacter soli]|uniref:PEGA domain-containing protein n=1 Tax=Gimibacter soli TaxID=3024400 RepID=A0AAE9XU61_9PROT|nr:hypothetical protein [Gimibacter soli]WCL53553.1 hypothetical protein PH603_13520 [Gimibacter soli]
MKLFKIVCVGASVLAVAGCASTTRGAYEALVLESRPGKAEVAFSNGRVCTTPCSIEMWRKHGVVASISRPGYQTMNVTISAGMDVDGGVALFAGNLAICCGLVGVIVDIATGSNQSLSPNPVILELTPLAADEARVEPVVKPGESFSFEPFVKEGVRAPLTQREQQAALMTVTMHLPENNDVPDDDRVCSRTACMDQD